MDKELVDTHTQEDPKIAKQQAAQRKERMLEQIGAELQLPVTKVRAAMGLLDEGNTIPFIARYRKEMTGELDENQLRDVEERLQYLRNLEDRKLEVIRLIDEQGKLTEELRASIEQSAKLQEIEDLYRPYRQKRKTRASVARERGLEPLAVWIMAQLRWGLLRRRRRSMSMRRKKSIAPKKPSRGLWISLPRISPTTRKCGLGCGSLLLTRER